MANSPHPFEQTVIQIAAAVVQKLNDHMKCSPSTEVCGILLGKKAAGGTQIHSYRRLRNVAPDPLHHFQLHPSDWIKCCYEQHELIGLFHSHPYTAPVPSQEDIERLSDFAGLISVYVIGSPPTAYAAPGIGLNEPLLPTATSRYSSDPSLASDHNVLDDHSNNIRAYNVIRQYEPGAPDAAPQLSRYDLLSVPLISY
ncbi:Mov34/MPN/PAD-1 family protein [Paenibacillus sp. SGZ-1009]|uniref:Mov34/MPN/PAD-1 family protein n=1 Tax=Paenibacillus campi TaxID=3106031 RepID=UPI002AFF3CA0|nr:Mov34/MPN/PAD-1 family protein [Paenibacillus sp. SGZ-1009]